MFDPIFDAVAKALSGIYDLPVVGGNYGVSIFLLTMAVMVLLMPLTLKATRSTIKMQIVQPQVKALQKEYKGRPREEVNAELMALYQKEGINPVGGCLPMLAQAPVFLVMFRVIRGLTRRASDVGYYDLALLSQQKQSLPISNGDAISPSYLDHTSKLYQDLSSGSEMRFGPFDLALHPNDVLKDSITTFLPYLLLIIFVVAASYYQQRQVTARRQNNDEPVSGPMAQQQALLKFLPLMTGVWSFFFPTGLVLYWAYQSVFRIAQQGYITRSLYGEEGDGTKAMIVSAEAKKAEEDETDEPDEIEKTKKSDKTKSTGKAKKAKPTQESDGASEATRPEKEESSETEPTARSTREAFFDRKREAAKRRTAAQDNVPSRLTPKGTKSAQSKNRKKRK